MAKRRTTGQTILLLDAKKLKTLSELIYIQEVNGIKNNPSKSEYDRRLHLEESREAHLKSLSITQQASNFSVLKSMSKDRDQQKISDIATSFKEYLQYVVGYAYSCIPNINLRREYLSRVEAHAAELKHEISQLDSSQFTTEKAEELYNRIQTFKRTTYEAIFKKADHPYRVLSRVTRPSLKNFAQTFRMVKRKFLSEAPVIYSRRYGVKLPLDNNEEVIDSMVDSLGNENPTLKKGSGVLKGVGRTVMFLTAAMMVYDAAATKGGFGDKVEALAKDATNFSIGYVIGGAAEAAVVWGGEAILGATLIGASSLLSFGLGALALGIGFAVAFFVGPSIAKAVDFVFHHIRNLFVKHPTPKKHEETRPPVDNISVANVKTYVTPPPDGLALANRIAYRGGK